LPRRAGRIRMSSPTSLVASHCPTGCPITLASATKPRRSTTRPEPPLSGRAFLAPSPGSGPDLTHCHCRAFLIHEMPRTVVDTPIGPLGLLASDVGLRAVLFDGDRVRPEGGSPVLDEAARQLGAYFDGDLVT